MSHATMDFDVEWCCWAQGGWENACEGSIRNAARITRSHAHSDFAKLSGEPWPDVRVWKRYIRPLDRQERYEWWVESRTDEGWEGNPDTPPDGWEPSDCEDEPTWEFVHRSHAKAIPVWVCGFKGDDPPRDPAAADRDKPDGCRAPHCFSEYGTPCGNCPVAEKPETDT